MPYKKEANNTNYQHQQSASAPFKIPKGQIKTFQGNLQEIEDFYNEFEYKIKASNIFPSMANGSNTGIYTIIVFYDK